MNTLPNQYGTFEMIAYKSAKFFEKYYERKKWFAFSSLNHLPINVKKSFNRQWWIIGLL